MTVDETATFLNTTFVCTSPKTGATHSIRPADAHYATVAYLFQYAVTQMNDTHAGESEKKWTKDGVCDWAGLRAAADKKLADRWADLIAGTPPGTRAPASPEVIAARKDVDTLRKSGIKEITPEMLAVLVKMAEKAKKAA